MKDIYIDRVANNIDSCVTKVNVVKGMITGERPADPKQAEVYLREVLNGLEKVRDTVVRG